MTERTVQAPRRPALRYQLDTGVSGLMPAERVTRGKTARAEVPRESHAVFDPPPDRPDPLALLEEQAKTRVPDLVPIRWGRMLVSPFTFYRGAALPMASDLATTPVTGLSVQACGDAHLSNFGVFGSAERNLVFDVNDFDETLPGPWEWDVKRLAASLEVAARGNGFGARQRRDIVTAAVARYRLAMRAFAGMTNMQVWYARADVDQFRAALDPRIRRSFPSAAMSTAEPSSSASRWSRKKRATLRSAGESAGSRGRIRLSKDCASREPWFCERWDTAAAPCCIHYRGAII